ncbi:MAG: hypothetical protein IKZ07_09255 [Akkermansia sp.]|nr:hypothetical protein [Akkermansia sp.]
MKTLYLMTVLGVLPVSATVEVEPQATVEVADSLSAADLMMANALKKLGNVLASVNDCAGADAVAEEVEGYCSCLNDAVADGEPQWGFSPEPMTMEQASMAEDGVRAQVARLRAASYFGSVALAEAIGDEASCAVLPTAEQLAALLLVADNIRELSVILKGVEDTAAADAAAGKVETLIADLPEKVRGVELPRRTLEDSLQLVGMSSKEMSDFVALERRLRAEYFYGSTALAAALRAPAEAAVLPTVPTEDVLAAISAEIKAACVGNEAMQGLMSGGPGTSQATAWVIAETSTQAVSMQYRLMSMLPGVVAPERQALVPGEDGRYFDCHQVIYMYNGKRYRIEQWFDITAYFRASYGSAE